MQDLANGHLDVKALGEAANGDENTTVTTRTGQTYPSAKKALKEGIIQLFENGGLPATPFKTKALMTASSLVDGDYAQVTDDTVNNGLYYKDGGVWVKSDYDPLVQAKTYTDSEVSAIKTYTDDTNDILNMNALTGIHDLNFYDAIELVPTNLRKELLTISVNGGQDVRTFINNQPSVAKNWSRKQHWIKQDNSSDDAALINFGQDANTYNGFNPASENGTSDGEGKITSIIKLKRAYDDAGAVKPHYIGTAAQKNTMPIWGYLDKNGLRLNAISGKTYVKEVPPEKAEYVFISKSTQDFKLSNAFYLPDASSVTTPLGFIPDTATTIPYKKHEGESISVTHGINERQIVNRYFKSELINPDNKFHIAQIVKGLSFTKGHRSLINKVTGEARDVFIDSIKYQEGTNRLIVKVSYQAADTLDILGGSLVTANVGADGIGRLTWNRFDFGEDSFKLELVVDCNKLRDNKEYLFGELYGAIHPDVIMMGNYVPEQSRGLAVSNFIDGGTSVAVSGQKTAYPEPLTLVKNITNGSRNYLVKGDADKEYQQTTLLGEGLVRFNGKPEVHVITDSKASHLTNPKVTMIREKSGIYQGSGSQYNGANGLRGEVADSQWTHPDSCYADVAVAGYKYWMINSVFPNGNQGIEDGELFVSNDGLDWKRVKGANEVKLSSDPNVILPPVYWNSNGDNGFLPVPMFGTFDFMREGAAPETLKTFTHLAHDPAIAYHDGYIIVYTLHNFGFVSNGPITHKYIVCLRTNNGIDWEIVRQDGSTMPYNETNAKLVYSTSGGVRNHIAYWYNGGDSIVGRELSPQIVKVSDSEFYLYTQNNDARADVSGGHSMRLLRYKGTTPYTFDFTQYDVITKDSSIGGKLWHFGAQYYNGTYYILSNGYMFTSTDGINFTSGAYPFFWSGLASDLYKPSFVVGEGGKVKIAYGIAKRESAPNPLAVITPNNLFDYTKDKSAIYVAIMATVVSEYPSLTNIIERTNARTADAYVDVSVTAVSQRTRSMKTRLIPCVRADDKIPLDDDFDLGVDDMVYVSVYLNTRHGGELNFHGVSLVVPD